MNPFPNEHPHRFSPISHGTLQPLHPQNGMKQEPMYYNDNHKVEVQYHQPPTYPSQHHQQD